MAEVRGDSDTGSLDAFKKVSHGSDWNLTTVEKANASVLVAQMPGGEED